MATTRNDWESLRDTISKLNHTQHSEIFRIIKNSNIQFTRNKSTVYIVSTHISPEVLTTINERLNYRSGLEKQI